MINTVTSSSGVPESPLERKPPQAIPVAQGQAPAADPADPAKASSDLRLIIERDSDNAYYIYKLIDRATGAVVAELPRDKVVRMAEKPTYAVGDLVSTKA